MSWTDEGVGMTDADVAGTASRFSSKRLIKYGPSNGDSIQVRLIRGPFKVGKYLPERVWWPSLKMTDDGDWKGITMQAIRPETGWAFDDLAARHVRVMKAAGVDKDKAYSQFSARRVYRFAAFQREVEEPNAIRILDAKKSVYDDIVGVRDAVIKNKGILTFGPIWSYDFSIVTHKDETKSDLFGTKYAAQAVPPQPLAGKVAYSDRGKAWTLDELAESGCLTDDEMQALQNPDVDPTQDLQPTSNTDLVSLLEEFPIYLLATTKTGRPYYDTRFLKEIAEGCKNLGLAYEGQQRELAVDRQLEDKSVDTQRVVADAARTTGQKVTEAENVQVEDLDRPVRGSRRGRATGANVKW